MLLLLLLLPPPLPFSIDAMQDAKFEHRQILRRIRGTENGDREEILFINLEL